MNLSRGQFFGVIGVTLAIVVLAGWWFLFRPSAGGPDGGATQIDHMTTDPQFADPKAAAANQDSGGTLPASNAP